MALPRPAARAAAVLDELTALSAEALAALRASELDHFHAAVARREAAVERAGPFLQPLAEARAGGVPGLDPAVEEIRRSAARLQALDDVLQDEIRERQRAVVEEIARLESEMTVRSAHGEGSGVGRRIDLVR